MIVPFDMALRDIRSMTEAFRNDGLRLRWGWARRRLAFSRSLQGEKP